MDANAIVTGDKLLQADSQPDQRNISRKDTEDMRELTQRFRDALKSSVAGIIEAGQVLIEAKSRIEHGQFTEWVVQQLRFGKPNPGSREADIRKAEILMVLAKHEVISNSSHWHDLPPSIRTLYELTQIGHDQKIVKLIEKGKIYAGMTREEAMALKPKDKRHAKQRDSKPKLQAPIATLVEVCLLLGGSDRVKAHIKALTRVGNNLSVQKFDDAVRWAKPQLVKQKGDE